MPSNVERELKMRIRRSLTAAILLEGRIMAKTEKEKAEEILKKRRLAAKGLAERGDGQPIDPMEDIGEANPDLNPLESEDEKRRKAGAGSARCRDR
jgi:hypothetical protein